jgi:hypothetical protein
MAYVEVGCEYVGNLVDAYVIALAFLVLAPACTRNHTNLRAGESKRSLVAQYITDRPGYFATSGDIKSCEYPPSTSLVHAPYRASAIVLVLRTPSMLFR